MVEVEGQDPQPWRAEVGASIACVECEHLRTTAHHVFCQNQYPLMIVMIPMTPLAASILGFRVLKVQG